MDTEFLVLQESAFVRDLRPVLEANEDILERLSSVYLLDSEDRYTGTVSLGRVILAGGDVRLKDLAGDYLIKSSVDERVDRVALLMDKYSLTTLPIVDEQGRLLGVVSADDIIDLAMRSKFKRYDVAISYAFEDLEIATALAESLKDTRIDVFFDQHEAASLWGKDLYQHLHDVYSKHAHFVIIVISKHYVHPRKQWTKHELKASQARQLESSTEYLLPLRLDDSEVPGLPRTMVRQKKSWVDSGSGSLPSE